MSFKSHPLLVGCYLSKCTYLITQSSISDDKVSSQRSVLYSGKVEKTILAFSLYSNGKRLLDTRQPPGAITCINGIRFFSMSWVVLGHCLIIYVLESMSEWKNYSNHHSLYDSYMETGRKVKRWSCFSVLCGCLYGNYLK